MKGIIMTDETEQQPKLQLTASEMGHLGGLARAKSLGKEAMSKIGKKAAKVRWGKRQRKNARILAKLEREKS